MEKELADLRDKYDEDMSGLRADHQMKIEEFEEELDILETENNRIRNQLLDTERELSEVTSNYDRDQALWQDKFAFLESQKNQAKKDLQDAHQKVRDDNRTTPQEGLVGEGEDRECTDVTN